MGWKSWSLKELHITVASSRLNVHARNTLQSIITAEKGFLKEWWWDINLLKETINTECMWETKSKIKLENLARKEEKNEMNFGCCPWFNASGVLIIQFNFFHFVLPVGIAIITFTLKLVCYVMSCNVLWWVKESWGDRGISNGTGSM